MAGLAMMFMGGASMTLGMIGTAIGGPIGGFIGSTLGSMIDNQLHPQKMEGPRLDDLTVTVSTYGNAIPILYGPENRITGNVIWSTGLIETKKKSKQGGKGGPTVQTTEYSYRVSLAVLLGEGVLGGVKKIWGNTKTIFDANEAVAPPTNEELAGQVISSIFGGAQKAQAVFESITFYSGTMDQGPDPTIESYEGVGNVPAYIGSSYVVIKDLQLADFGNRIPNLEFLVEAQPAIDCRAIVADICRRCGLDLNLVSTSSISGDVRGYAIGRPASGLGAIQPLALVYGFDVAEAAGGLRIQSRESGPLGVVLTDDLGGHANGEDRPEAIRWARAPETTLPASASLVFLDAERDYQKNSQRARRASGSADSNLSTDVPVVMDPDQGQRVADRMLWEAWMGRQTATAKTDDRWIGMQVGRQYVFETPAGLEPLRVTRKTRGWNGVIDLDLRRDSARVYQSTDTGVSAAVPSNILELPGETELILLDIPLLLDGDNSAQPSGFYWGVVGSGLGWRGADFKRALDAMGTFQEVSPQGFELTVGEADNTLGDAPGDIFSSAWDEVNTILVTLRHAGMTLESLTEDEVLAGGNALYVGPPDGTGGEILQFRDATPTSTENQYELSGLLRGRKGTEFATGSHGAGELVVLLEPGALRRSDFGTADLNLERAYKAVSLLTLEADADAILFTNTGVGLRPYSPVDLAVAGDTGDDLVLTWTRRSRIGEGIDPPPLGEDFEAYLVRIMNALGTVVVREIEVTEPTFTYTGAMQVADFGGPVADLRWRVAQMSAIYGPGIFQELSEPV